MQSSHTYFSAIPYGQRLEIKRGAYLKDELSGQAYEIVSATWRHRNINKALFTSRPDILSLDLCPLDAQGNYQHYEPAQLDLS